MNAGLMVPSSSQLHHKNNRNAAFTRVEMFACLGCVALLGALALPALGTSRARSDVVQCFNNLRRIGHAVRQWSGDHFEDPPWLTLVSDGGTKPNTGVKAGSAWVEYLYLSNELVTPHILACPSDASVKVAADWSNGPNGLANPSFRAQANSYALGLHANSIRPKAVVAADFNLSFDAGAVNCGPTSVNNASAILLTIGIPSSATVRWTNGPHSSAGHLLLVDGSVIFLDSKSLREVLSGINSTENGSHHMVRAR